MAHSHSPGAPSNPQEPPQPSNGRSVIGITVPVFNEEKKTKQKTKKYPKNPSSKYRANLTVQSLPRNLSVLQTDVRGFAASWCPCPAMGREWGLRAPTLSSCPLSGAQTCCWGQEQGHSPTGTSVAQSGGMAEESTEGDPIPSYCCRRFFFSNRGRGNRRTKVMLGARLGTAAPEQRRGEIPLWNDRLHRTAGRLIQFLMR